MTEQEGIAVLKKAVDHIRSFRFIQAASIVAQGPSIGKVRSAQQAHMADLHDTLHGLEEIVKGLESKS